MVEITDEKLGERAHLNTNGFSLSVHGEIFLENEGLLDSDILAQYSLVHKIVD